jgi:hypothetical protein
MSNWAFVGISFGLTWVVLVVFTVLTARRLRAAERQLARTLAPVAAGRTALPDELVTVEAVR